MRKRILFGQAAVVGLLALSGAIALPVAGQDTVSSTSAAPSSAPVAAPLDPALIATGKHLWNDASCFSCHGNNGQGGSSVDFPHGPSLRTSGLDPQTMLQIVECGIPNTRMPAWLKGAYTEVACYGNPLGPAASGTLVNGAYIEADLKALVDYIQTDFMKQPMPTWSNQ